jgi:hypothetical protein
VPATYTGDQSQTQAPADPPRPDGIIKVQLPADGDPPNASTWEQAFKVLADYIDWLIKPGAFASAFDVPIMAWRTASAFRRAAIDHLGFLTGQVLSYDVIWKRKAGSIGGLTATGDQQFETMPEWRYKAVQTTGTLPGAGFSGGGAMGPNVFLEAGHTAADYVTVSTGQIGQFRADNHVVLEGMAAVPNATTDTVELALCEEPATHVAAAANFIGFRRVGGSAFWRCVTKAAGVETETTTAAVPVLSDSLVRGDRLRVEWHGETVADDATRAVRFYVNGTLVATHLTNLPLNASFGIALSDLRNSVQAADFKYLIVGPLRLRMSLSELDTVL